MENKASFDTTEKQRARDHDAFVHSAASGHCMAWKINGIATQALPRSQLEEAC
jgi:hypothetical protein